MKFTSAFCIVCSLLSACLLQTNVRAEEPSRTWRDAAGKFSIEAKLIEVQADTVRLQKASGDTINVPLAKLSDPDRAYIKSKSATTTPTDSENPFATPSATSNAPSLSKIEPLQTTFSLQTIPASANVADLPDTGNTVLLPKSTICEPLTADAAPAIPDLKASLVAVAPAEPQDDLSQLVTLNSRQALVAMSIARRMPGSPQPPFGKLVVGQLPKGPFTLVSEGPEANRLFDHNELTGQTLLVSNIDELKRGGELVVMEGLANGKPVELYRRRLPGIEKPDSNPKSIKPN